MELIDVHCHLDNLFFKEDIHLVIENAKKSNLKAIIPAGVDPKTNREVLALKERYPGIIFPTLGAYPVDALKNELGTLERLNYDLDEEIKFIYDNKDKIIGIGEVGMDFKDGTDPEQQKKNFRKMIELAIKIDKPLIIHSRKAEAKVIEILETYKYKKIVMHCFGGNHNLVRKIRENQWFFSIPTSIVRDEHFQKIIKETPLHLILTETDSPFLSPFREKRNEPSYIIETIKKISELKNMPEEDIAGRIWKNARILFSL